MKTIRYFTSNGYIDLSENGNTYVGKDANKVLTQVFIPYNIETYEAQKEVLEHAVENNKLTK